jgi:predicted lysophospholipase L1 biosynthesis ABC-type transport system permease subunit
VYPSAFQREANGGYHVFLRTDAPLDRLEAALREAVAQADPDIPVPALRAETEIIAQATAKERVFTQLLTIFGGFALLLASIGLHGVTSYTVTRRASEFGVRAAMGARPGQILWLVLKQVVVLAGIGLVVGVPAALAATPLAASLLYGVAPMSPAALIWAAVLMLAGGGRGGAAASLARVPAPGGGGAADGVRAVRPDRKTLSEGVDDERAVSMW